MSEDKTLQFYCHYPLVVAEQEFEDSQKEMYRIVTINWTYATNKNLGIVDYEHVYKNIYEMSLGEFLRWWWDMEVIAEDIISIERIYQLKGNENGI